ncbi:MAG TPA: hypothetical protein OIM45_06405 [Clostridiaceae bacterium]|jgi:DnaJ-class molecular chaperone|nr:hypothetical protein [Clostridiaceae bacterium]
MFSKEEFENELGKVFEQYFNSNDIYTILKITKSQARNGCIKQISINRKIDTEYNQEKEIIIIPKNTQNNKIIELKGKGNKNTNNGKIGNLYIKIHIFGK